MKMATRRSASGGPVVGRRYVDRLDTIGDAQAVADLYHIRSWDLHPLRGDRTGQFAIRLTGQMRLIIIIADDGITVEEVTDYHG